MKSPVPREPAICAVLYEWRAPISGGGDCRAAVLGLRDWGAVREQLRSENLLQARTSSSALRLSREVTA